MTNTNSTGLPGKRVKRLFIAFAAVSIAAVCWVFNY